MLCRVAPVPWFCCSSAHTICHLLYVICCKCVYTCAVACPCACMTETEISPYSQSNLVKQLGKLVKVRYVEDITATKRVGEWAFMWQHGQGRDSPTVMSCHDTSHTVTSGISVSFLLWCTAVLGHVLALAEGAGSIAGSKQVWFCFTCQQDVAALPYPHIVHPSLRRLGLLCPPLPFALRA